MTNKPYHIPIHFDEDGRPWKEYDDAEVNSIPVTIHGFSENGMFYKHNNEVQFRWSPTKLFKRPAPYVYGAGGERIYKDDTVYKIDGSSPMKVTRIVSESEIKTVYVEHDVMSYDPSMLTHSEPDSLEKLQQFVVDSAAYADGSERDKFMEIADRLSALIDKDA